MNQLLRIGLLAATTMTSGSLKERTPAQVDSIHQENRREGEGTIPNWVNDYQKLLEQAVKQEKVSSAEAPQTEDVDQEINLTLERNQRTNTEEQFWTTASKLEEQLNRKNLRFALESDFAQPEKGTLVLRDGEWMYKLSLPNKGQVNLAYQYNVLFEEFEWKNGEFERRDEKVIQSNLINLLVEKIANEFIQANPIKPEGAVQE
ncbi:hypothetical protein IPG41_07110 [Candidatus Peregrinibacteria bacterium]|nr:MAG: hypothetical protein IPG41_07110 [Candidatus Peregrinibacteria bacterium]